MKIRRMAALLVAGVLTVTSLPMNSLYAYAETPANGDSEVVSEETTETEEVTSSEDESLTENESETDTLSEAETETGDESETETESESEDPEAESKEDAEPKVIKGEITKSETVTSEALMTGAVVASGTCGTNATWSLDEDGTLTISGSGAMTDYSQSDQPYKNKRSAIKKIKISAGITSVGTYAFYNCSSVTEVELSNSISKIGKGAFSQNTELTSITIPFNVQKIESSAFEGDAKLATVRIESRKLSSISPMSYDGIFGGCNIQTVDFAPEITTPLAAIPANLFCNAGFADNITITIPATVSTIGNTAFFRNSKKNINFVFEAGSLLQTIGERAFMNCQFASISLPDSLVTIEGNAFSNNALLTEITIPKNVVKIGRQAFSSNTSLHKVRLEARNITDCSDLVFENCIIDTIDFAEDLAQPITKIPKNIFNGAGIVSNTEITIPATVQTIGESAFEINGVRTCRLIINGNSLKTIGNYAFQNNQIKDIVLPESLEEVGTYAFSNNDLLEEIVIPKNVKKLGFACFADSSSLHKITILSNKISYAGRAFDVCTVDELYFGNNVTAIPEGLLSGTRFTNATIVLPVTLKSIGRDNFNVSSQYLPYEITIPESVTSIGDYVFGTDNVATIFNVVEGSYAYRWALGKKFKNIKTAYAVKYNLNGGTNDPSNPAMCETGDTVKLAIPSRTGYTFEGWFSDSALTRKLNKIDEGGVIYYTMLASGSGPVVYAKWSAAEWDVNFDVNGEYAYIPSGMLSTTVLFNSTYPVLPVPERTGYTFKGWYTAPSGGTVVTAKKTKLTTEGGTLYAQWTPNTYTVRMHSNLAKDTVKNQSITYDVTAALATNTFKQTGYIFTGWNTAKDGSGTAYTDKQSVLNLVETNKGTFDLYGQWKKVDYFIFFDGATLSTDAHPATSGSLTIGGSDLVETDLDQLGITNPDTGHNRGFFQAVQYGESIELTGEEFVRRGYTLTGWKNSKTGKVIAKNATLTNLTAGVETVTLTAQWSLDTYTVKYNLNGGKFNGGSGLTKYTVETAEYTLPTSAILVRPGYTFTGWYDNNALTGSPIEKIAGNNELRSLNLYAGWAPVTYNIARDSNIYGNDTDTKNTSVVKYDEKYTLNKAEFTRPGYTLSSWNTQRDGKGKKYSVSAVLKNVAAAGETYTVYAQWSPNTYKVTYNLNGGKQTGAPTTYKPSAATTLKIPVKTGYTFTGWTLTMKDGTANTASVGNDATPATVAEIINEGGYGNIVLTAGWEENVYNVNFHINRTDGFKDGANADTVVTKTYKYTDIINLTIPSKELEAKLVDGAVKPSISGFTIKPAGGTKYVLTQKLTKLKAGNGDTYDLYSSWGDRTYYITYDYTSEGEDLTGVTFRNEPYTYSSATGVGIPNPSKKGYVFTEWKADKNTVTLEKSKAGAWSIKKDSEGDTKLTATFEPVKYSVTVYPNGSGVKFADDTAFTARYVKSPDTYHYSVTGSLPAEMVTLTRAGYDFVGYNTKANGTGIAIDGDNIKDLTTSNNANVNIYAIWKAHGHEVQYEYALRENGVDGAIDESDIVNNNKTEHLYASVLKLSNPTKTGYTFNGWLLTSDDNSVTKSRTGYVTQINAANDADVSLKAIFTENKYTLSINSNGGVNDTTRKAETLKIGTIAYTDEVDLDDYWTRYTRKGYEFKGFATDKNGKNMLGSTVEGLSAKNGAAVVVYAIWTKVSPVKPSNVVVTSNEAGKINVTFTAGAAIAGIDGTSDLSYEIQYSKGLIFRNAPTITTHNTTESISNSAEHPVTSGTRYQVRIRECRTDSQGNTVYSAWSLMKGVTVQ